MFFSPSLIAGQVNSPALPAHGLRTAQSWVSFPTDTWHVISGGFNFAEFLVIFNQLFYHMKVQVEHVCVTYCSILEHIVTSHLDVTTIHKPFNKMFGWISPGNLETLGKNNISTTRVGSILFISVILGFVRCAFLLKASVRRWGDAWRIFTSFAISKCTETQTSSDDWLMNRDILRMSFRAI